MIELKELITLAGILVSLVIGVVSIIIGVRNSKRTIYINSITANRIIWMANLRELIAEFSSLTILVPMDKKLNSNDRTYRILHLHYLLKLQLNRQDAFDKALMNQIDDIIANSVTANSNLQHIDRKQKIDKFILLSQDLLKLEWEGIKAETEKGNLSKKQKAKLYKKYLNDNK